MMKYWLAGAAAFAMMSGVALAQGVSTQSTTTVTTPPPVSTYTTTQTQRSTDSNGTTADKMSTYQSGPGGSKEVSKSQTVAPDGSMEKTYQEKRVDPLQGSTTYEKKTTTTTDR